MKVPRLTNRSAALLIGASLIVMAIVAAFSAPVMEKIYIPGNPGVTAFNTTSEYKRFNYSITGWLIIFLLDVLLSGAIYSYYKQEKYRLSITSGLLRILYSLFLGIAIIRLLQLSKSSPEMTIYQHLQNFHDIWGWGLIAFGFHLITLGMLFNSHRKWLNITINTLLISAGAGYLIIYIGILFVPDPPAFKAKVTPVFLIPMIFGEIFFAFWMLIKGGKN